MNYSTKKSIIVLGRAKHHTIVFLCDEALQITVVKLITWNKMRHQPMHSV